MARRLAALVIVGSGPETEMCPQEDERKPEGRKHRESNGGEKNSDHGPEDVPAVALIKPCPSFHAASLAPY